MKQIKVKFVEIKYVNFWQENPGCLINSISVFILESFIQHVLEIWIIIIKRQAFVLQCIAIVLQIFNQLLSYLHLSKWSFCANR
jgi:hypothetical protein